jgi:NTP pyrophosphatase (non-canonical NTP hydrolase)
MQHTTHMEFTPKQLGLLERAISKYGPIQQMDMVTEECAELIQAVCKLKRNTTLKAIENLHEEIADVEIMIEQLKIMYSCHGDVKRQVDRKMERLGERLQK